MDNVYRIVTLANGVEVKVRPVSPHVRQGLYLNLEEALPAKPDLPTKQMQSVDGHVEHVPVQEGDSEYELWKAGYTAWSIEHDKIKAKINQDNMLRVAIYAVIGWRIRAGLLIRLLQAIFNLGWKNEPPAKWKPDSIIRVPEEIDTRGIYVITEIISNITDYRLIKAVAFPIARQPLTGGEVERQLDGFSPDD